MINIFLKTNRIVRNIDRKKTFLSFLFLALELLPADLLESEEEKMAVFSLPLNISYKWKNEHHEDSNRSRKSFALSQTKLLFWKKNLCHIFRERYLSCSGKVTCYRPNWTKDGQIDQWTDKNCNARYLQLHVTKQKGGYRKLNKSLETGRCN